MQIICQTLKGLDDKKFPAELESCKIRAKAKNS
jgi:hypothetical protein